MNKGQLEVLEREGMRRDLPPFRSGDTVRVHVKIREGEKERIQVFEGVVIRRRGGGPSATFTVRKVSYGVGVERIFPVQSPVVEKVEIRSRGHVRRSRIYYLRERRGKKARLRSKVRDLSALVSEEELEAREEARNPARQAAGQAAAPGAAQAGAKDGGQDAAETGESQASQAAESAKSAKKTAKSE